jgi:hypothetical protein
MEMGWMMETVSCKLATSRSTSSVNLHITFLDLNELI